MNMQTININDWNPEIFENKRTLLLDKFQGSIEKVKKADSHIATAKDIIKNYEDSFCDDKISSLDVLAFVEIDVNNKDVDNYLFGEISKIIEASVDEEVSEMINASTEKDFKRQITPSRLIRSAEVDKNNILSNDIMNEMGDDAAVTIRCMELYNDVCNESIELSEETKKKQRENQQFLYIINTKMRLDEAIAENHIHDTSLYSIALVSVVKDGSKPSLSNYREEIVSRINKGLNLLATTTDVKASIKIFNSAENSLEQCKKYLDNLDTSTAKNTKLTIEAIQDTLKDKMIKIDTLYELE